MNLFINEDLPEGRENYELIVEVNFNDKQLIEFLEKTNWEHFSDGGMVFSRNTIIDEGGKTMWYGLKRESAINLLNNDRKRACPKIC